MPESAELAESLKKPVRRPLVEVPLGLHYDLPDEVYHQRELGIASHTALEEFDHSPLSYRTWVSCTDEASTPALHVGKAFHCLLLEPDRFATDYLVVPDFGNCSLKANKDRRNKWRADNNWQTHDDRGTAISVWDHATIAGMARSLRSHDLVGRMLAVGGRREVTAFWDDAETGVRCKARADYWIDSMAVLLDLKSTGDARLRAFRRATLDYGYHRQAAFYRDGFAACGHPIEDLVFIACEKTAPYLVQTYHMDAETLALGQRENRELLQRFAHCLAANEWPGLPATITPISLKVSA